MIELDDIPATFTLPATQFADGIDAVAHAAADAGTSRAVLTYVKIEQRGSELRFVASDGRRLAWFVLDHGAVEGMPADMLMPAGMAIEVSKAIRKDRSASLAVVEFLLGGPLVRVTLRPSNLDQPSQSWRFADSSDPYPAWEAVIGIEENFTQKIQIDGRQLRDALKALDRLSLTSFHILVQPDHPEGPIRFEAPGRQGYHEAVMPVRY